MSIAGNGDIKQRLQERFEYVRKGFFPEWDPQGLWKATFDPDRPPRGICLKYQREIIVSVAGNDDELDRTLIHEICHAHYSNHGLKWQALMIAAAGSARKLGRNILADDILFELVRYQITPKIM